MTSDRPYRPGRECLVRRGIALPMVILLVVVLFAGGMTISYLLQGVQKQMRYADATLRVQYIAESGMNLLLARMLAKPWSQRWFATAPDSQADIRYEGGSYDYFLHDTPGRNNSADLWIRSTFGDTRRNYFWRIVYDHGLLSGMALGVPITRIELPDDQAPTPGTANLDQFTALVESHLQTRKVNREPAAALAQIVKAHTSPDRVLDEIGFRPPRPVRLLPFPERPGIILPPIVPPTAPARPSQETIRDGFGSKVDVPIKGWIDKKHGYPPTAEAVKKQWEDGSKKVKEKSKDKKIRDAQKELRETLKKINKEMMKAEEKDDNTDWGKAKKPDDDQKKGDRDDHDEHD